MNLVIRMMYYYFLYSLFADVALKRFYSIDDGRELYYGKMENRINKPEDNIGLKSTIKSRGKYKSEGTLKSKWIAYGEESKKVWVVIISTILSACVYLVNDSIVDIVPTSISLFIISNFLIEWSRFDKYYFTALFVLCVYTTDILFNIFSDDILSTYTSWDYLAEVYRYSVEYLVKIFILYLVSKFILYFFKDRSFKSKRIDLYNKVYILSIFFILVTIFIYGRFFRNMIGYGQKSSHSDFIAILCVILLIFNIFVYTLCRNILRSEKENILLSMDRMRKDMDIRYMKDVLNRKKIKDSILHDTKRNYTTILQLMEDGDYMKVKSIIQGLLDNVQKIERKNYTSNKVMNAIISEKESKILGLREDVFECDIDMAVDFSIIEDVDLITIFSNALDNAIEASFRVEKPKICFCARNSLEMNSMVVRISNRFDGVLNMENGRIITSKDDKLEHGIGIPNIEKTVKKYDGSVSVSSLDGVFNLGIIIPYTRSE